ncbi:ferritin-like domain-containing protein [Arenimonas sp.]|uniref:ferritin-like domain-containing protein n=1 Tax=Arenimonas sp. TaxID=1872635 RepID=UPI0035B2B061
MKEETPTTADLFQAAADCIAACEPAEKLRLTHAAAAAFRRGGLVPREDAPAPLPIGAPGRPGRPRLVLPRDVPQRGLGSVEGRAAFLHAIAHIEFNAINLAWDAVYRFRGLPAEYYADWVGVADDEARHFALLSGRLAELGFGYGDFDAHNGLWEMAGKTAGSGLQRMALVPRVLEARGLDVTPGMIARLRSNGDNVSADILEVILREEVAHVAAGSRWFHWHCEREGLAPVREFIRLVREAVRGGVRGPFNRPARLAAGFDDDEIRLLESLE